MWSIGQVHEVTKDPYDQTRTIAVKIKYVNDISVCSFCCSVDNNKIAPLNQKRDNDQWRAALKKGDKVDAMDRSGTWFEATVIAGEERSVVVMPMVKIGFRQYDPNGNGPKEDIMGTYYGLSEQRDEHIGSYTVRI